MQVRFIAGLLSSWLASGCQAGPERACTASSATMGGSIAGLDDVARRTQALRQKLATLTSRAPDPSRPGVAAAVGSTQEALERIDALLQRGAADEASAAALVVEISGQLDLAEAVLDSSHERTM